MAQRELIGHIMCLCFTKKEKNPSHLSTEGGTRAAHPGGCSTGVDWGTLTEVWNTATFSSVTQISYGFHNIPTSSLTSFEYKNPIKIKTVHQMEAFTPVKLVLGHDKQSFQSALWCVNFALSGVVSFPSECFSLKFQYSLLAVVLTL